MTFSKKHRCHNENIWSDIQIENLIKNKTNHWLDTVQASAAGKINPTTRKVVTPMDVTNLFCKDGILWGTVSRILRQGPLQINDYFKYFAKIPGLRVLSRSFHIYKITETVYVNNADITWFHDNILEPLQARMTFIFREDPIKTNYDIDNWSLFELHSSELPAPNDNVK